MNATAPAKFTFDLDMSARREKSSVLTDNELNRKLDAARQEGFDQGYQEGTQSAEAQAQRALQAAAENLAQQAVLLLGAMDRTHRDALQQAAHLGLTIGRKLATHLVARFPEAELQALIGDSMQSLEEAPHLVVRCNPDLVERIQTIAEEQTATSGFSGRLLVMGEPEIGLGDGRIEWADGGLVRDSAAISEQIDTAVSAWLDAHAAPEPQGEQS